MGHLNGILARVGGNLNNNFQKSQMPGGLPGGGGGGGMLKLRFDRYISKELIVGKKRHSLAITTITCKSIKLSLLTVSLLVFCGFVLF